MVEVGVQGSRFINMKEKAAYILGQLAGALGVERAKLEAALTPTP